MPPIAPTNLTIQKTNGAQPNYFQLELKWSDNSNDEIGFIVEEQSKNNSYIDIGYYTIINLNANTTTTNLVTLIYPGNKKYYRVYSYSKGGGNSSFSNEIIVSN
jgi:hypothetical protein